MQQNDEDIVTSVHVYSWKDKDGEVLILKETFKEQSTMLKAITDQTSSVYSCLCIEVLLCDI